MFRSELVREVDSCVVYLRFWVLGVVCQMP
jgi:hypothetical protein